MMRSRLRLRSQMLFTDKEAEVRRVGQALLDARRQAVAKEVALSAEIDRLNLVCCSDVLLYFCCWYGGVFLFSYLCFVVYAHSRNWQSKWWFIRPLIEIAWTPCVP